MRLLSRTLRTFNFGQLMIFLTSTALSHFFFENPLSQGNGHIKFKSSFSKLVTYYISNLNILSFFMQRLAVTRKVLLNSYLHILSSYPLLSTLIISKISPIILPQFGWIGNVFTLLSLPLSISLNTRVSITTVK